MLALFWCALALAGPAGPLLDPLAPSVGAEALELPDGDVAPPVGVYEVEPPAEPTPLLVVPPEPETTITPYVPPPAEAVAEVSAAPGGLSDVQLLAGLSSAMAAWALSSLLKHLGDRSPYTVTVRRAIPLCAPFFGAAAGTVAELLHSGRPSWAAAGWGLVAGAVAVWGQEARSAGFSGDVKKPPAR